MLRRWSLPVRDSVVAVVVGSVVGGQCGDIDLDGWRRQGLRLRSWDTYKSEGRVRWRYIRQSGKPVAGYPGMSSEHPTLINVMLVRRR